MQIKLPAVISVGDAINEPRYPSLKAIMGAKKKPLETVTAADAAIDASKVGGENSAAQLVAVEGSAGEGRGRDHRGRRHAETVERIVAWLETKASNERRTEIEWQTSWSTHSTTKARSTRTHWAPSPRAPSLAAELGGEAHAILVGEGVSTELAASVGSYGANKALVAEGPEGPSAAGRRRDGAAITAAATSTRMFGGGLLGFEIGAGLAARLGAGVAMEVTAVRAEDGELIAERPILGDSAISEESNTAPMSAS